MQCTAALKREENPLDEGVADTLESLAATRGAHPPASIIERAAIQVATIRLHTDTKV
jgi:hypothetical protein